ncbi:MAG: dTDP-glucose 4,6-dehydratase [Treponema sp.]|nr:dTDP-glucose 4,6-dehydratase [Treponema sp.]
MRKLNNILVTGGAGFIGSNFIHYMLDRAPDFKGRIINLDALTYAGNPMNLADIEFRHRSPDPDTEPRYIFEHGNICSRDFVDSVFRKYEIDTVVHFAAESHVDRSIIGPEVFINTNVMGTFTLLEAARSAWKDNSRKKDKQQEFLFHQVSTDEVFGSLGPQGYFTEASPYDPHSPYSASKAGADHMVMAYSRTYGLPITISNCSNNYGPRQFPEKLIPLMILNIAEGRPLPVYGDGRQIRDWLYVEDHVRAVWTIMRSGITGEKYNIGGDNEWENINLLNFLIDLVAVRTSQDPKKVREKITHVEDRPGHDRRYAIDCSRIKQELGWKQSVNFEEGLARTVDWYLDNTQWTEKIRTGEYRKLINRNYTGR